MISNHFLTCRILERGEIDAILARNSVGRIAYFRADRIDIEPVHYVYANGWLYGRTSPGRALERSGTGWWPIAFEVDEIGDLRRWRNVVINGGFYTLDPHGSDWEREEAAKALALMEAHFPGSFADDGAGAEEEVLFRIGVQEVTGREALHSEPAPEPPGAAVG